MNRLTFAFFMAPGAQERQALILARSIRSFAGALAESPIWALAPKTGGECSDGTKDALASLNVRLLPFEIEPAQLGFPFAGKVFASAEAEYQASKWTELLVWMDTDSIVVKEPEPLLLQKGKKLGYRPVDHTLIGSLYDEPTDSFWELIYLYCSVPRENLFPMTASVDQKVIRPYFNAGMLVVRPEQGLLRLWSDNLKRTFQHKEFEPFFQQNQLYSIFFHQAILAGSILSSLEQQALEELPYLVNYPLHMHSDYPVKRRPAAINDVVTCRYDTAFRNPDWQEAVPVKEPLISWLKQQLDQLHYPTSGEL